MVIEHIRNAHCGPDYTVAVEDGKEYRIDPMHLFTARGQYCTCGGSVVDGLPETRICRHIEAKRALGMAIRYRVEAR